MNTRSFKLLLFGLALLIVLLDRVTKLAVDAHLAAGAPLTVFPGFDLLLAYNTGAAFSFLSEAGGWQRWLLTGISLGVSLFIAGWLLKLPRSNRLLGYALAFILGGALGNLYDRMTAGFVVDFISLYAGDWRFATFNIADSAITIGAGLMILDMLLDYRNRYKVSGEDGA